ncbi:hypothetical protein SRS16CHR_02758 [Variovorax sp. SRS16]|uniref:hypothetical protein n=1 Tax=Variovorax sp. SRS16 TaxID=282217 RepID=UPI001316CABF|nr:hypothetical protein SRS16CHR_02758 [Variovorax sp. SRS16]
MEAIRNVLVTDATGAPSTRHRLVVSTDWDEVQHWCRQVYMPCNAAPVGSYRTPDSVLDAIRHWSSGREHSDTGVGEAFLVDNSRTHYWLDADRDHLQVNLTFQHDAMAALHERWFGQPADERMWTHKFRFGGAQSSWISLLSYVCRCITEMPDAVEHGPLGRHLEESIGLHLLTLWRQQMHTARGVGGHHGARCGRSLELRQPRHVRGRLSPTVRRVALCHAGRALVLRSDRSRHPEGDARVHPCAARKCCTDAACAIDQMRSVTCRISSALAALP